VDATILVPVDICLATIFKGGIELGACCNSFFASDPNCISRRSGNFARRITRDASGGSCAASCLMSNAFGTVAGIGKEHLRYNIGRDGYTGFLLNPVDGLAAILDTRIVENCG
jgi:hypothetical protein